MCYLTQVWTNLHLNTVRAGDVAKMRGIWSQQRRFTILDRLLTTVVHMSPLADFNYLIAEGWLPPDAVFYSSMTELAIQSLDLDQ